LTTLNLRDLVDFHKQQGGIATIATHNRKVHIDLGVIEVNGDNSILNYIEKPTIPYQVSMGIYVFEPKALGYIARGNRLDFPDLILCMLKAGERVVAYPFEGYWQDLGRPDDYEQANIDFERMRTEFLPGEDTWTGESL
jgi:NDP-mannose synthase